ncbi:S8 family serine peptidase [Methylobacterium sp. J-092]|uniref:S8 family serine peptidase n=1 Tax=Methylobacterium sp. J-092 TaxID=2836667 RepID=UPI001FB8A219|nr:S8 family serine peptidase [Methylobacterium sp. J-092]MCJ2006759.1 S8 family serine peptidase [Methylobacterium sp. J-092]
MRPPVRAIALALTLLMLHPPLARMITLATGVPLQSFSAIADDEDEDDDDDDKRPELAVTGLTEAELERLRQEGFGVVSTRRLGLLPGVTARLTIPQKVSRAHAVSRVRAINPSATVDGNTLYRQNYTVQSGTGSPGEGISDPFSLVDWPHDDACAARGPIGLIDTSVDLANPALAGRSIERETIRGPQYQPSSTGHGTAIAVLLVGHGPFEGGAPDAKLVAVDAFHRDGTQDLADTFDLVTAIDLLVARKVSVINLSIAGAENALLDRAGRAALDKGVLVAAAAGNNGPAGPPSYPAAYPWAVAVTAVDGRLAAYPRAARGGYIALAAPGVRLALPATDGKLHLLTGTSFAAPFVTVALDALQGQAPGMRPTELVHFLKASARDLGAPGPDPVFGAGLLQLRAACGRS